MVRDSEKENREDKPVGEQESQAEQEKKEGDADRKSAVQEVVKKAETRKLSAMDKLVRTVSLAGIFLLAFFIFSNQSHLFSLQGNPEGGADQSQENVSNGADDTLEAAATQGSKIAGESSGSGQTQESSDSAGAGGESIQSGMTVQNSESGESRESGQGDESQGAESPNAGESGGESSAEDEDESQSGESKSVGAVSTIPESYTVQAGDSLYTISMLYYGDYSRVTEICELNNIENPNYLQMGTEIKLPQN